MEFASLSPHTNVHQKPHKFQNSLHLRAGLITVGKNKIFQDYHTFAGHFQFSHQKIATLVILSTFFRKARIQNEFSSDVNAN